MSMELRPIYLGRYFKPDTPHVHVLSYPNIDLITQSPSPEPELPERNGDYDISSIGPHYDLRLPAFEEGSTRVWANDATSQ